MKPEDNFFPPQPTDTSVIFTGISVRDYIAIEAMKGVINARLVPSLGEHHTKFVARVSYEFADALIAESNK